VESNPAIRLSLFWIEHNAASEQDTIPSFPPPDQYVRGPILEVPSEQSSAHLEAIVSGSRLLPFMSTKMHNIYQDISALTLILNGASAQVWLDANYAGLHIYPTLHKLLTIQSEISNDAADMAEEILRLGGLLFLAGIRRRFGISPVVTHVQISKLQAIFEQNQEMWRGASDSLQMWVLFMAGCAATTREERAWAVKALMRQSTGLLVFPLWDDIMGVVTAMWWIGEVFSISCRSLKVEYEEVSREV
jgi:hypothetical protein